MRKLLLLAGIGLLAVVVASDTLSALQVAQPALRIAVRPAANRALSADVIVLGKVASVEKDTVQVPQTGGVKDATTTYKIAIVKVDSALCGSEKLKEIKVGFLPKPEANPNIKGPVRPIRGGVQMPELKEGQELALFLTKHPSADFYVMPGMAPPLDVTTDQGKKDLDVVKKVCGILADPKKALKNDNPDERADAATVLIMKYRAVPQPVGESEQVAIPADETKELLRALTDGEWSLVNRTPTIGNLNPVQAFHALGLTDKDGWIAPAVVPPAPGAPQVDFNAIQKDAFMKWLEGPGKNYQIKKYVPKAK